jgi:type II secretory pathway component PulK
MRPATSYNSRDRRASVLVLTLIVVAMLTLGAAAFFERMFAEHQAERTHGRQLQSAQLAESGAEYIKAILQQDPAVLEQSGGLYGNQTLFQGILVNDDPSPAFRGKFTILAPDLTTDGYYSGTRFGLENESARLNINTVLLADSSGEGNARKILMGLPGMTEQIADAILDWIDADDEQRDQGAEREYYSSLSPPYAPRNGPLASIEELLLVKGVTPALLFGADLNRNGEIDGHEENLTTIDNADNSTGQLNRGWAAYLTVDSAEANVRPDGKPKIDVNMDDLNELHKQLSEVLSPDEADFIVAFRQGGAYTGNEKGQSVSAVTVDLKQKGNQKLTTILDLIGVRTRIAKSTSNGSGSGSNSGGGTGGGGSGGSGNGGGSGSGSTKQTGSPGGTSTTTGTTGTQTTGGSGNGGSSRSGGGSNNSRIVVEAAFPDDKASMQDYLPKLMDNLAVNAQPSIPGRLNINQAPRALLAGIPNFTPEMVDQVISNRDVSMSQQRPEQKYETWLLSDGIVDLATMKKLMPLITGGGSVYRAQVVGGFFNDPDLPSNRIEVLIDGTKTPPMVRRRWDLTELGAGYKPEVLGATADDAR